MIHIGTSGFSYDDWKGRFYPERTAKKDMLTYYTRVFDCVEIDSTYYAIPAPATFESMNRRTPDNFRFAVKAHKDMTHTEPPDPGAFDAFLQAIDPIHKSGKLSCVLAQYPWACKKTPENMDKLIELKNSMRDIPTVVEFRNSEWANDETYEFLRALDLGYCCVDEPNLKGLMPRVAVVTSSIAYVRFHGRNSANWWKREVAHERYDYLYSEEELSEWLPSVCDISSRATDTFLFFNNHYQGKSAQNARMFAKMLDLPLNYDLPMEVQPSLDDLL